MPKLDKLLVSALGAATLLMVGCAEEAPSKTTDNDTQAGKIILVVTVDWEGRDLKDDNLGAMNDLRDQFPDVVITHYLNAAYFTKPGADAFDVGDRMYSPLRDGDEVGLHIHGWKRLFEASGVKFRNSPTFWDPKGVVTSGCSSDCGHEVPISAYEQAELEQVIRFSVDTLEEQGFGRPTSFRAGGWMAAENVRAALLAEGFRTDGSAVPSKFLKSEIGTLPLWGWVDELWKGTDESTQPFTILEGELPDDADEDEVAPRLLEIPDNGALADYMTAEEMFGVYEAARDTWREDKSQTIVVSIGFHQETAAKFLPTFEDGLRRIVDDADENRIPLESSTSDDLRRKF